MTKPLLVPHLEFDHTYCEDVGHKLFRRLAKVGFKPRPGATEHPGGAVCKFILINEGLPPLRRSYLEFVHLKLGDYKGQAGLALRAPIGLDAYFNEVRDDPKLAATFTHRNYDWQKGEKERRPGWNYVQFKRRTPRACNVWLSENEVPPGKNKRRQLVAKHRNGALRISGFHIEIAEKDRPFFSALFRGSFDRTVILNCGTRIHFTAAKRTRLVEVAVAVKDLDRVNQAKHKLKLAAFDGKPALRIGGANPAMWDIILVQA